MSTQKTVEVMKEIKYWFKDVIIPIFEVLFSISTKISKEK